MEYRSTETCFGVWSICLASNISDHDLGIKYDSNNKTLDLENNYVSKDSYKLNLIKFLLSLTRLLIDFPGVSRLRIAIVKNQHFD